MSRKLSRKLSRKFCIIALLTLSLIIFTGCWDKVDLNDRAFVISIGLDKMTDENIEELESQRDTTEQKGDGKKDVQNDDAKDDTSDAEKKTDDEKNNDVSDIHAIQSIKDSRYIFSASIPDLKAYDGGQEKRLIKKTAANTVMGAIGVADSFSGQRIYLGHTKVAILGEELLNDPEMFSACIDVFERDTELSRKLSLFVTDKKAYELLEANTKDDPIFFVSNFLKNNTDSGSIVFKDDVESIIKTLRESGCAVIPKMTLEGSDLRIGGAGVINNFKLAGYLDDLETRGLLWIKGKSDSSIVEAVLDGKDISYKILSSKRKISFTDELVCKIDIDVKANVSEYGFGAEIKNAEDTLSQKITNEVLTTLKKLKELDTDGLGFNQYLKKQNYNLYLMHDNVFDKLTFEVGCKVELINKSN